ncbi:MAG TPA: CoA transferase [Vineibacter sp.]|nr:CoA transferase [Vineibacter sp.]
MAASGRPPLEGIRVLDFSRVIAGPACTQALADMGAEIVKVEDPDGGDDTRRSPGPMVGPLTHFFVAYNRGKKSLALDIGTKEGQAMVQRLLARCDVLIENFRPGIMKRFGLDYGSLKDRHPRLVYVSISAYGQSGPMADRPGFDPVLQAESGMMAMTGEPDGSPLRHPLAIIDTLTSVHATAAILAALYARRDTGRGQHVDLALFDVAVAALGNAALYYLTSGQSPPRTGNAHMTSTPTAAFPTANGLIYMAVSNQKLFADMSRSVGHPEWVDDPRFKTTTERTRNRAALFALMNAVFATDTKENWARRLRHLPVGPVRDVGAALESEEAAARGVVRTSTHPALGDFRTLAPVYRLSDTPVGSDLPPPLLGEHSDKVLRDIAGCDDAEIAALRTKRIVGSGD